MSFPAEEKKGHHSLPLPHINDIDNLYLSRHCPTWVAKVPCCQQLHLEFMNLSTLTLPTDLSHLGSLKIANSWQVLSSSGYDTILFNECGGLTTLHVREGNTPVVEQLCETLLTNLSSFPQLTNFHLNVPRVHLKRNISLDFPLALDTIHITTVDFLLLERLSVGLSTLPRLKTLFIIFQSNGFSSETVEYILERLAYKENTFVSLTSLTVQVPVMFPDVSPCFIGKPSILLHLVSNGIQIVPYHPNLVNLRHLRLENFRPLTVPEHIRQMSQLRRLEILTKPTNAFQRHALVQFPEWIADLKYLEALIFTGTDISDEAMDNICSLTELRVLHLSNDIDPFTYLPDGIGNLENLEVFSVRLDESTPIPLSLSRLHNIKSFTTVNFSLSCFISKHLKSFPKLSSISGSYSGFLSSNPRQGLQGKEENSSNTTEAVSLPTRDFRAPHLYLSPVIWGEEGDGVNTFYYSSKRLMEWVKDAVEEIGAGRPDMVPAFRFGFQGEIVPKEKQGIVWERDGAALLKEAMREVNWMKWKLNVVLYILQNCPKEYLDLQGALSSLLFYSKAAFYSPAEGEVPRGI